MDSPADALLALSNTAAAIADSNEPPRDDDDRSSSLSELEDAPDAMDVEEEEDDEDEDEEQDESTIQQQDNMVDGDSEAETERLEESPDKAAKKQFQISPSKLAQSMNASDDIRPEIEELTNSEPSSPMTPPEDSPIDDLSEAEDLDEPGNPLDLLSQAATVSNKRKRLSDVMDIVNEERPRKRRTESLSDPEEEDESEAESDSGKPEPVTRGPTVEPEEQRIRDEDEKAEVTVEEEKAEEESDSPKQKKPEQYTRSRSRRGKNAAEEAQDEGDKDSGPSDEEAEPEGDEVETTAKTEEEQQKRAAAMDALTSLEKHFATLRDKLYDEKIAQLNHDLNQLSSHDPCHPELLKQFDCINRYRDDKQSTEQKLLVFKVGALKRKSVAERSQLHSAYFQTVRDVRERHMENMASHFYRIQRERFKSSQMTPTYTIPFPEKRAVQVGQQTAYNREVSVLSGVARYIGFPSAPELKEAGDDEINGDLAKMGINTTAPRLRQAASARHDALHRYQQNQIGSSGATAALSSSAAAATATSEQQFIESTPWANPNHPIHRLGRQNASKSPFAERPSYQESSTPAHQQRRPEHTPMPIGSASTIVEHPSAQPTPGTDLASSAMKQEPGTMTNGTSIHANGLDISPTETRRTINNMLQAGATAAARQEGLTVTSGEGATAGVGQGWMNHGNSHSVHSSPLLARASLLSSLNRTASAAGVRESTRSPFRQDLVAGGDARSGGMGRFGFR